MPDYSWKPWSEVKNALNETVLVMFIQSDGSIHIEDATILYDEDHNEFYYCLFDGEQFALTMTPSYWMLIPDEGLPNGIMQNDAKLKLREIS